ncbi:pyridoxal 5'-phosphate synthase glutaminase subunit PdxT [Desertimonas flava]|uniref:pyridoxal 5'-phosphate synthase glutaminase subunit PdxT n=1 Tax=Desertimonas flava TaxID=2064846 RepID=UPI001D0BF9BA|nr:pyridoxal 5'-phosphate synthase glutaminase subunit PdxT [Desertimonas flava]
MIGLRGRGTPTVGVLALQGAFRAHADRLRALGASVREVRTPIELRMVDGLVMPGGESTTMSNLLTSSELFDPIAKRIDDGMPVFATCAGMILLAGTIRDGRDDQRHFGALDITVRRNGYGRQIASFETELVVAGLDTPFHGVFIRAPRIEAVGDGVEVLARHDGEPVLVRHGSIVAASFHPELTADARLHGQFLGLLEGSTPTDPTHSSHTGSTN